MNNSNGFLKKAITLHVVLKHLTLTQFKQCIKQAGLETR